MNDPPDLADSGEVAPAPARSRRRRPKHWRAALLVALAVALAAVGWVSYQYAGTDLVARRAQREAIADLRQRWSADPPAAPASGEPVALLRIPAFGAAYEVPILEGVELDTLIRGVGHYPGTAEPGQVGNFALAGHCATHARPFGRLLDLDRGDEVVVETRNAIHSYVIVVPATELTVDASAGWVLDAVPGESGTRPVRELITLTTCQDLIGSPDRAVAFGQLRSSTNKG